MGETYYRKGNFKTALVFLLRAIKINEQAKNALGQIPCYFGIASIQLTLKNYKMALSTYLKCLKIGKEIGNKEVIAKCYGSIGNIYQENNNNLIALEYYKKSLDIKEELNEKYHGIFKSSIAVDLINVSYIQIKSNNYQEAKINITKALKYSEEINSLQIQAYSHNAFGLLLEKTNKLFEAEKQLNKALILSTKIGEKDIIKSVYQEYVALYEKKGDYKQALNYQKLFTTLKDSMFNTESSKQITEMNTKYETELKDKELIKKDSEIKIQQADSEKQAIIKNGFIIGFIFLLGLILFIYRGYIQKQKTNKLLNDKNQKITDSINYAKLIQSSILPSQEEIKKYLPQSFVFYEPKDIVSGDFYWLYPINATTILFAVIDCTGHGVPGALMSMLGYSLLEQIVNQNKTIQPSEILNQLNFLVIESLKQSANVDNIKNGMDMALFKLNYTSYELEYSGAKNPLYIVRDQQLIELKADRKSIGLSTGNITPFTNQLVKLQSGDHLYAFSDGYIDQKGGAENKKFYSANLQKLLVSINGLNASEKEEQVKNAFYNWKSNREQIDDVLVFGMKV